MKLNLLYNDPQGVRKGFVNIDPFADGADRVKCQLGELGRVADAGSVEELVAHGVIDRFSHGESDALMGHWMSRVAMGGKMTVSCVDIMAVATALRLGQIGADQACLLLYGSQESPPDYRLAAYSLPQLSGCFEDEGWAVLLRRSENFSAVVTAQRPGV